MAHIIPAQVFFDKDSDEPPKLVLDEAGSELGELIAERGIEIEEESCGCSLPQGQVGSIDQSDSPDASVPEPENKPVNSYRACMSDQLRRPTGSEPLTQLESRHRFREAAQACKIRRQEEDDRQDN